MSGATIEQPRAANGQFVSLEQFVTMLINERSQAHAREHILIEKAMGEAAETQQENLAQARVVVDERLEKLNELRSEVIKDRAQYITRTEFQLQVKPLQEFKDKALGFGAMVAIISAVTGSVVTALVMRMIG